MKQQWYGDTCRLGMVGGGQLGRMFIQSALSFDVHVHALDPDPNAPCKDIAHSFTIGSLNDFDTLYAFGRDKHVMTVEIENVCIEALEQLEKEGVQIFPQPRVLRIIRDKGIQKEFYKEHTIPTADFQLFTNAQEIIDAKLAVPFVQKLRTGGYDGRGVQLIKQEADFVKLFEAPSVVEQLIPFQKELSVIVARNEKGDTKSFPAVECEFHPEANLVEFLFCPADIKDEIESAAHELAKKVICDLDMVGLLAVELFLTADGQLLVNEIAPRPHNSGHHTIECNVTSQFEQHLRSVLGLPLGNTDIIRAGAMINLLGAEGFEGPVRYEGMEKAMELPGVHPHLYGKAFTKPFRKMGHVTITGTKIEDVKSTARTISSAIVVKS
jgi:5-(carboxyamino)imidazole ribonucleotide synthase